MMSKEVIEAVRAVSDIASVAGEHVQLRRLGSQLRGRCPLHPEKTPSLYICPSKGVFHCHGCGAGGDVFEFVQLLHGCSFPQAVEFLAGRAGMHIDGFKPSPELTAKVSALKAQREADLAFKQFCDACITTINERYRALGRAATHAENCLGSGLPADPYLEDFAWTALQRYRDFENRVERCGLCDLDVLKTEWEQIREIA
jgi:DNA primase